MQFICPICDFQGEFVTFRGRLHARCPQCYALERHRFQFTLARDVFTSINSSTKSMLHFAPEKALRTLFAQMFSDYQTADLFQEDVDHKVDIQMLPFADESFDVVYASHVLEHIPDDAKALSEIHRILRPAGIAILPVPIMGLKTIEYDAPDPLQDDHVRAPGIDYFDRYTIFSRVDVIDSYSVPEEYQPFVYLPENMISPFTVVNGCMKDFVPICYK
jgi:SAM-dependent methyltransferase